MTGQTPPPPRNESPGVDRPNGFALFGEMGLVSVLTILACLLLVPWLAGVAAGVAHMRRHLAGLGDSIEDYTSLLWQALKGNWLLSLASMAVVVLLYLNTVLLAAGAVPGGRAVEWAMIALGVVVWTILVRAAALWSSGEGETAAVSVRAWWALLAAAARTSLDDPIGTLLLASSFALGALLVWMFLPVAIAVPGLWVLAAVGVEFRRRSRAA